MRTTFQRCLVFLVLLGFLLFPALAGCGCAAGDAEKGRMMEVTTEDGHGYEMSRKDSDLKDMLMDEIVAHFTESLS